MAIRVTAFNGLGVSRFAHGGEHGTMNLYVCRWTASQDRHLARCRFIKMQVFCWEMNFDA